MLKISDYFSDKGNLKENKVKCIFSSFYKDNINNFTNSLKELYDILDKKISEEDLKNNYISSLFKNFKNLGYKVQSNYNNVDLIVNYGDNDAILLIETKVVNHSDINILKKGSLLCNAFYETVRYYYFLTYKINQNIQNIIITDGKNWFIFDEKKYREHFYKNPIFEKYLGVGTLFDITQEKAEKFDQITKEYLLKNKDKLNFDALYFEITKDIINNYDKLIKLYYLFSPYGFFQQKIENSNIEPLNKRFYSELLYILGLKEVNHKIEKSDTAGSLYNLIEDKLKFLRKKSDFETIIQIIIIWLNRILFLKVFEYILIKNNNFNYSYRFFTNDKIKNFSELNSLFFEVLAVTEDDRDNSIKEKFKDVPYLNSSLFELHDIELEFIRISDLSPNTKIKIYNNSILKEHKNLSHLIPDDNQLPLLKYLLEFLNCYKFYEDNNDIQDSAINDVINPSVLGLVYEKLNGYKEGSFYTKTEITGYMSQKSINMYLINSINKEFNTNLKSFQDLCSIYVRDLNIKERVIELLKGIKIIDPAVGSGHFLVSALDYLVYLYYYFDVISVPLNYLKRFKIDYKDWTIRIYDNYAYNNNFYHYKREIKENNQIIIDNDINGFQEYIFNIKKYLIENCLFGVDINSNSTEISRLRLWIELLKNTYYTQESNYTKMRILPNIDINISVGDALVDEEIISDKQRKISFDKDTFKIYKEYYKQYIDATGENKYKIRTKIKEAKHNFYNNANKFSYLIEFPHAVDDNGNFTGFSVVLMNPPYIRHEEIQPQEYKKHLVKTYKSVSLGQNTLDLYIYFLKLGYDLLKDNGCCYAITSNKWFRAKYGEGIRKFLKEQTVIKEIIDFNGYKVFDVPTVDTTIIGFIKEKPDDNHSNEIEVTVYYETNKKSKKNKQNNNNDDNNKINVNNQRNKNEKLNKQLNIQQKYLTKSSYLLINKELFDLKEKIEKIGIPLKDWDININMGIKTGYNKAFIIDENTKNNLCNQDPKNIDLIKPILRGRDVQRYNYKWNNLYVINLYNGWTKKNCGNQNPEDWFKNNYNVLYKWFENIIENNSEFKTRPSQGDFYWETQTGENVIKELNKNKIIWNRITNKINFSYDNQKYFVLDSTFFITSNKYLNYLYYLCGILNSNILQWWIKNNTATISSGSYGALHYIELSPIPLITPKKQNIVTEIENKVDKILNLKQSDSDANTSNLEREIDELVYELYELNDKEKNIIYSTNSNYNNY